MKVIISIWDIIIFGIIGIVIIFSVIFSIVQEIKKIGKKNCYECKHYKLDNVASCGDCCWYRCIKHNRKDNGVSMNEEEHYERCKDFLKKSGE